MEHLCKAAEMETRIPLLQEGDSYFYALFCIALNNNLQNVTVDETWKVDR